MKIINTMLVVAVLFAANSAAKAAWMCSVNNDKNLTFTGMANSRATALANAMAACSKNTVYAKNCVVQNCSRH